jgi:hypothetical protein
MVIGQSKYGFLFELLLLQVRLRDFTCLLFGTLLRIKLFKKRKKILTV